MDLRSFTFGESPFDEKFAGRTLDTAMFIEDDDSLFSFWSSDKSIMCCVDRT